MYWVIIEDEFSVTLPFAGGIDTGIHSFDDIMEVELSVFGAGGGLNVVVEPLDEGYSVEPPDDV